MNNPREIIGKFSWKRFWIILIVLFLALMLFSCSKDDPIPYYEVVPVVEVSNAFFDEVDNVRLNITLTVDGVATTQTWDIPYKGVRYGCNLLKWTGKRVEYQAPTVLKLAVQVLYDVGGGPGYVPIENFSDGYLPKEATWIRSYFEVRDQNNPSDRFVGIEAYSNPSEGEYQVPEVIWQVTQEQNFVPIGQASPQSNLRIAEENECKDCIWTQIK